MKPRNRPARASLFAWFCFCAFAAGTFVVPEDGARADAPPKWYRGNTHAHTVLCGHADSTPEVVARWYLDRGYHFLCLSEHNRYIDPAGVKLPPGRREDFILIPGEEITGKAHMTGLNLPKLVGWAARGRVSQVIQTFTDRVRDVGGVPILNHPNFQWAVSAADLKPVKRLHLFELYNGHPSVNNEGDADHPSTEAMWDELLTGGMVIYGVSSDDAHEFKLPHAPGKSNPGRGWVMVRAAELTPGAVAGAIERGDFYASSGVFLSAVEVTEDSYRVAADLAGTEAECAKPEVIGRKPEAGEAAEPGCRIDFIGPGGKVLRSVNGAEATMERDKAVAYLRAKVTYTREAGDGTLLQYAAWTQPAFNDGRRK